MRLDGWKSIAAHFGRERSTVMRWASERDLPVHRIPGARRGSVFALTEELDAWLEAGRESPDAAESLSDSRTLRAPAWRRFKLHYALPAAAACLGLAAWAWPETEPAQPGLTLPQDNQSAAIYLEARADWAERRPDSIERAIGKLQQVVAREPGFTPAYAALADCYLLAREFGSRADEDGFARAQSAVDAALRIDPNHPDALRAKGFIAYWWRRDGTEAVRSLERSLALSPDTAQTHFWYGNILVDNGDFVAGREQLNEALRLEPASVALKVDSAWAAWSAGEEGRARAELERLRSQQPSLATIRDYLAVIYLAEGDLAGFVAEARALADIRQIDTDSAQARRFEQALQAGDGALERVLLAEILAEAGNGDRGELAWPAFVASSVGDRAAVLRLLETAEARKEHWGSAGLVRQVAQRWQGDAQVSRLLADRRSPSLVIPSE